MTIRYKKVITPENLRNDQKIWPLPRPKAVINMSYENVPCWRREIPQHFKTQEMCDETVA